MFLHQKLLALQACQLGCRAVSHLVYGQPTASRIYADLVRLRAMTAFLFVLLKHHKNALFCRDALCCIANCASYPPCAEAVMERGINVVCKVSCRGLQFLRGIASMRFW